MIDNLNTSHKNLQYKLLNKNTIFTKFPTTESIEHFIKKNALVNPNKDLIETNIIVSGFYANLLESIEHQLRVSNKLSYTEIDKIQEAREVIDKFSINSTRRLYPKVVLYNRPIQEASTITNYIAGSTVTSLFLYLTGIASTFISAISFGVMIPAVLLVSFAYLTPRSTSRAVKQSVDKFAKLMGDTFNAILQVPELDKSDSLVSMLDELEINPDIRNRFKNDDTMAVISGMSRYCNTQVNTLSNEEIGREINVRNISKVREIIQRVTIELSNAEHKDKYLYEYRKCILQRLIDLYKLIFIGIFVKYMEYNHTKKVITSSYSTKMLFTYFQNVAKVDSTFKKRFESLIKLRNLIEFYPELIEKTEDMSSTYKSELINFITNELKSADKDLNHTIKSNIDKIEYETAKKAFINTTTDLKVLDTFLDPIKKAKKNEKEKENNNMY